MAITSVYSHLTDNHMLGITVVATTVVILKSIYCYSSLENKRKEAHFAVRLFLGICSTENILTL